MVDSDLHIVFANKVRCYIAALICDDGTKPYRDALGQKSMNENQYKIIATQLGKAAQNDQTIK
jgi:hypothetical protein